MEITFHRLRAQGVIGMNDGGHLGAARWLAGEGSDHEELVAGIFEVPEDAIADALRIYFVLANLKCEPTGALPLGALMLNKQEFAAKRVCLVVSGGNVDGTVYARMLQA